MGKEVACRVLVPVLEAIRDKKVPPEIWLDNIPYSVEHLQNKHERIEWSVLCQLFKNTRSAFSDSDLENIGRSWTKNPLYRPWATLTMFLFNREKYLQSARPILKKSGSHHFSCIDFHLEEIKSNGFRVILSIKDDYEFCREYFLIVKGALEIIPKFRGYSDIVVAMKWLERGAVYECTYKRVSITNSRLFKKITVLFNSWATFQELNDAHEALLARYEELEKARSIEKQQTLQIQTAHEIYQVIRQGLNLDFTLHAIVRAIVEIAGFAAAEVKIFANIEGTAITRRISQGEVPVDIEPLTGSLTFADNAVGVIRVWSSSHPSSREKNDLFQRVMPMFNVAIHDALVYNAILDYRNNLERKVEKRTTELTKARNDLAETVRLLQKAQNSRDLFFANISHEFRTPLTLILGPISAMLAQTKSAAKRHNLSLIQLNTRRLEGLINQLLALSRLEAGRMTLQAKPENIVALLNRIAESFESSAKLKGIKLRFRSQKEEIIACIDREKIEVIFYNLLSNALKFTSKGGSIECTIRTSNGAKDEIAGIIVTVADTGIGIPADRKDQIFDRFYQVDDSFTREHRGTGIGLALTKELVELHRGEIKVESELGKGTEFEVYLPLGKEQYKPGEIASETLIEESEADQSLITVDEIVEDKKDFKVKQPTHKKAAPLILLVEDNADMRSFIRSCLASDYRIIEAIDGEEGFRAALVDIPDLIISDIMMPKIDGFQLCQKIKTDERTSHIPVILLTARAAAESKIAGLETGADDYIIKPFDVQELKARIKNLIEQRQKLREKFSRDIFLQAKDITVSSYDQRFLQNVMDTVEQKLDDPNFNVTDLTRKIGMSRMQLHRKLSALTNQSTARFVRSMRLKKAAELLKQHNNNISQVSYQVGFANPSYFAACFRKQFGVLPSEYEKLN